MIIVASDLANAYQIVAAVLIVCAGILAILDIIQNMNDVYEDNLNCILHDMAYGRYYVMPFAFGFILGHLLLGSVAAWTCQNLGMLIGLLITIVLFFIGRKYRLRKEKNAIVITLLIVGVLMGHFMWSMNSGHSTELCFNIPKP